MSTVNILFVVIIMNIIPQKMEIIMKLMRFLLLFFLIKDEIVSLKNEK